MTAGDRNFCPYFIIKDLATLKGCHWPKVTQLARCVGPGLGGLPGGVQPEGRRSGEESGLPGCSGAFCWLPSCGTRHLDTRGPKLHENQVCLHFYLCLYPGAPRTDRDPDGQPYRETQTDCVDVGKSLAPLGFRAPSRGLHQ